MPLGWEDNTKYTVKSAKFEGGNELGVWNPRAPHLCMKHWSQSHLLLSCDYYDYFLFPTKSCSDYILHPITSYCDCFLCPITSYWLIISIFSQNLEPYFLGLYVMTEAWMAHLWITAYSWLLFVSESLAFSWTTIYFNSTFFYSECTCNLYPAPGPHAYALPLRMLHA